MAVKRMLATATRSNMFSHFVTLLESTSTPKPGVLRILTYHRVNIPERVPFLSPALNSASPEGFEAQMRFIAENYDPVSPGDLEACFERQISLPPRAVLVTFDDAYCDFAEYAWPVLKRHNIPVALFVPTGYPDQPERTFWWDRLHAALEQTKAEKITTPLATDVSITTHAERTRTYKQLRNYVKSLPHEQALRWIDEFCNQLGADTPGENYVLGWDALRTLAAEGVTLGAHTRSHPMLNRLSLDAVRHEVVGSLRDLREKVGNVMPIFAYPGGGLSDGVVNILRDEGFSLAFTTVRGVNDMRTADRLRLKRINVGRLAPLAVIRAQLLGLTFETA